MCVYVGAAPFSIVVRTSADTLGPHYEDGDNYRSLCCVFRFLPVQWPRQRRCLAFTSQKSTGVTMAVASARPSPPVRGSQTAVDTKRRSGSVLGKMSFLIVSIYIVLIWGLFECMWIKCAMGSVTSHGVWMLWLFVLRLSEDRVGDICNACVLLVKRWKKLPNGSKKNWNHVSYFWWQK